MLRATRWALMSTVLAGWLCLAAPIDAAAPEVKDEGKFFSAEAIQKANRVIAEIKQNYRKDLIIETYQTVPDGQADKVRQMKSDARNQYFRSWTAERARAVKADGVFILICRDPSNLQVDGGKETARKHFTDANDRELAGILRKKFDVKKFDEGLLEAAEFVKDTMRSNVKASAPVKSSPASTQQTANNHKEESGWGGLICMGLLIFGGIWLFIGLIRAFTGGMGGGGGYGGGGYGGGGGFGSSLMGGLFGAMAGMWMYNSMFGGGSSWGSQAQGSDGGTSAASDEGQGFGDGSGGDFGDSGGSSGGDWGGDSGGGGGDSGGGGDWGGGGGDFGGGGGGGGGDW